jgi:predicted dehydrogenase
MGKIGIGTVGSRFAADLHAHTYGRIREKVDLVAVCSKTRETAEAFAKKFKIPHVQGTLSKDQGPL